MNLLKISRILTKSSSSYSFYCIKDKAMVCTRFVSELLGYTPPQVKVTLSNQSFVNSKLFLMHNLLIGVYKIKGKKPDTFYYIPFEARKILEKAGFAMSDRDYKVYICVEPIDTRF